MYLYPQLLQAWEVYTCGDIYVCRSGSYTRFTLHNIIGSTFSLTDEKNTVIFLTLFGHWSHSNNLQNIKEFANIPLRLKITITDHRSERVWDPINTNIRDGKLQVILRNLLYHLFLWEWSALSISMLIWSNCTLKTQSGIFLLTSKAVKCHVVGINIIIWLYVIELAASNHVALQTFLKFC